jgi:hypothetical protein
MFKNIIKPFCFALLLSTFFISSIQAYTLPDKLHLHGRNESTNTGMLVGFHTISTHIWRNSSDDVIFEKVEDIEFQVNIFNYYLTGVSISHLETDSENLGLSVYVHLDNGRLEEIFSGQFSTIPFAFLSEKANVANSVDWSNVKNKPLINQFKGSISPSQIPNGIITSDMVGSISADKITNFSSVNLDTFSGNKTGVKEVIIENISNNNGSGSRLSLKGSNGSNTAEFSVLKDASSGINAVHFRSLSSSNDLFVGIGNSNYIQLDASEKKLVVPVKTTFGESVSFDGGFDLGSDISAKNESINNDTKATLSAKADGGTGVVTALSSLKDDLGSTFGTVGTTTNDDFKVVRNNVVYATLKKDGSTPVLEFETGVRIRGGIFENTQINPSSMSGDFPGITGVGTLASLKIGAETIFPWNTTYDVIQMDNLSVFSKDSTGGLSFNWYVNSFGSTLYGSGNDVYASSLEFNKATGTLSYKVTPTPEDGGAVVASMPSVFSINKDGETSFTGTVNGESASFSTSVSASNFNGSGTNITGIDADNISSGTISNSRFNALSDLGGGSGNTFLRRDGTWANPQPSESSIEQNIANDIDAGYVPYDNGSKLVSSGLYTNGLFGIGTDQTFAPLTLGSDVSGASDGHLGFSDGTDSRRARAYNQSGNFFLVTHGLDNSVNAGINIYPAPGQIGFLAGGETKMVLDSNGNLGLGIGIPEHKLHVKNGDIALGTYNGTGSIHFETGWLDEIKASGGGMEYHSGANHRFYLDTNNNQASTYLSISNHGKQGTVSEVFRVEENGNVTATGTGQFTRLTITDGDNDGGNVPKKPVDVNGNTISGIQPEILITQVVNLDTQGTVEVDTHISNNQSLLEVRIYIRDNAGNMYPVDYKESFGYATASGQKVQIYTEGTELPDGFRTLNLANADNATWKTEIRDSKHTVIINRRGDGFFDSSNFSNATVVVKVEWAN